jgi:hypothetical protein
MAEKKTKAMFFADLKDIVMESEVEGKDEYIEFLDKQIDLLAARAEKAQAKAAEAKEKSDELTEAIAGVLTDEFQTVDQIVDAFNDEAVTRNKVTARLAKLVKAERAEKESIKVDGNKRMAYRKIG